VLLGVTKRLNAIADTLDEEPEIELAQKLEGLTARSEALSHANPSHPELIQAQEELDEAQEKLRVFAASVITASPTVAAALVSPSAEPSSPTPAPTTEPTPAPTRQPAATTRTQVKTAPSDEDIYGLDWLSVTTGKTSFVMPANWRMLNVSGDDQGVLTLDQSYLGIDTGGNPAVIILVFPQTGGVTASIKGTSLPLRDPGINGETIAADLLIKAAVEIAGVDDTVALALHHFVLSFEVTP
jgi:hypothetical protein